jgi:hypothetical protein
MSTADSEPASSTEVVRRLCGTTISDERLQHLLAAYASILDEIARLRELDLTDVQPALIFEPTAVYRKRR